jgi:hypothetical protein
LGTSTSRVVVLRRHVSVEGKHRRRGEKPYAQATKKNCEQIGALSEDGYHPRIPYRVTRNLAALPRVNCYVNRYMVNADPKFAMPNKN